MKLAIDADRHQLILRESPCSGCRKTGTRVAGPTWWQERIHPIAITAVEKQSHTAPVLIICVNVIPERTKQALDIAVIVNIRAVIAVPVPRWSSKERIGF